MAASLFQVVVTGLPASSTEDSLRTAFAAYGSIHDLHLDSAGQARVSYVEKQAAEQAVAALHAKTIDGCEVTVVGEFAQRKEDACVHVKDLPKEATEETLREVFGKFGTVASVQIEVGKGCNYGYVQFDSARSASKVISVGELEVERTQVRIERFIPKTERKSTSASVYVRGFDTNYTEQQLKSAFAACGEITSCTINRDSQGTRVYGFVNFSTKEAADSALQLAGQTVDGITWFVSPAVSHGHQNHAARGHNEEWAKRNVYIAGFPAHLTETNIRVLCEAFGEIESIRMQQRSTFYSDSEQSAAFVCFKREQDADAAIQSLRHTMIERCPIRASKWKPIESRKALVSPALLSQWPFAMPLFYPPVSQRAERTHYHHTKRPHRPQTVPQPPPQPAVFDLEKFNQLNASDKRRMLGEYIFFLLNATYKESTGKITGMLLEVAQAELLALIGSPQALLEKAAEAMEVLRKHRAGK